MRNDERMLPQTRLVTCPRCGYVLTNFDPCNNPDCRTNTAPARSKPLSNPNGQSDLFNSGVRHWRRHGVS